MVSDCHLLPVRQIRTLSHLQSFHSSTSYERLISFINILCTSIIGIPTPIDQIPITTPFITEVFQAMENGIKRNPPQTHSSRFGNTSFRDWIDEMSFELPRIHQKYHINNWQEISSYLLNSLGDRHRIDYGTGHEAHFIIWMLLLWESDFDGFIVNDNFSGVYSSNTSNTSNTENTTPNLIFTIFHPYIQLMRKIHRTYLLEPAGSHGVWGLDDYHFLPFLFGANQLRGHKDLKPKHIRNPPILLTYRKHFIYFDLIYELLLVKPEVSLRWHAPLLDDISAVRSWDKVSEGLMKMYAVEVLSKLPIMQHLLFGSLFSLVRSGNGDGDGDGNGDDSDSYGNDGDVDIVTKKSNKAKNIKSIHLHSNRGDCCGNPIPSRYVIAGGAGSDDLCQHSSIGGLPID